MSPSLQKTWPVVPSMEVLVDGAALLTVRVTVFPSDGVTGDSSISAFEHCTVAKASITNSSWGKMVFLDDFIVSVD